MNDDALLAGVEAIARAAGAIVLRAAARGLDVGYKGTIDLVTRADRESEAYLVPALRELLPGSAVLAEEGGRTPGTGESLWIVDPLDGTTNFAHGYPVFSVSIALEREGDIVLGAVYDPGRDELFTARRGGGARLGVSPLGVSGERRLERCLLATGFPYDVHGSERDNLALFGAMAKRAQGIRRGGSAALDLAYVAAGRLDAYWEEKLAPWDMAAGLLMVEEAGGVVTDYHGDPPGLWMGHVVASNARVHEDLLAVVRAVEGTGARPAVGPRFPRPG